LVNNQIGASIDPFNFKNPEAIAEALIFQTQERETDFRQAMETIGISKYVLSVEYDPESTLTVWQILYRYICKQCDR
jgi:hypothetical protein